MGSDLTAVHQSLYPDWTNPIDGAPPVVPAKHKMVAFYKSKAMTASAPSNLMTVMYKRKTMVVPYKAKRDDD